jgi:hypothetical protein
MGMMAADDVDDDDEDDVEADAVESAAHDDAMVDDEDPLEPRSRSRSRSFG